MPATATSAAHRHGPGSVNRSGAAPARRPAHQRWRVRVAAVGVLALIATSCTHLAPIPGAGPLRYRDTIFSTVTKTTDVVYGTAVDAQGATVSLKLDVYRPVGDSNVKRPLIIFAHGGSFRAGNKNSAEIVDEANTFAKKGYVTASIDYRLSTDGLNAIYRAVHDAETSVRFFRAQASTYGVDPNRIAFGGSSAGAIMALLVGFNANLPGDVGSNPGFSSSVGASVALSGAAIFNNQIGPGDAPSLLFHGTADPIVGLQPRPGHREGGEGRRVDHLPGELAGRRPRALRVPP